MTSKTEKQTIRIYIFPNNSKIKAIRQEIWTVMRIMWETFFFKNHAENVAGKLVQASNCFICFSESTSKW